MKKEESSKEFVAGLYKGLGVYAWVGIFAISWLGIILVTFLSLEASGKTEHLKILRAVGVIGLIVTAIIGYIIGKRKYG